METPRELEAAAGDQEDIVIRKQEYDGETVIAVDFGPAAGTPSLDIVGDRAIVVLNDDQFEFEIPPGANEVFINDGILTIKE